MPHQALGGNVNKLIVYEFSTKLALLAFFRMLIVPKFSPKIKKFIH